MTAATLQRGLGWSILSIYHLAAVVFLLSTAFTCYPGLHHDSVLYSSPIVNSAARGAWEVDTFVRSLVALPSPSFNRHGQLYQWLFGRVLHCTSYEKFFAGVAILNTVTFALMGWLVWRTLSPQYPRSSPWLASGIATMTALCCLEMQGRPEHLIPLLMLLPFIAREFPQTRPHARRTGYAVLGLVFVTSPLPGVLCTLGVLAWIGLAHRQRFIREVIECAIISLSVAVISLLIIAPVNPWQWALNTVHAGKSTPENLGAFFTHHLETIPLWNLIVLGGIALLGLGMLKQKLWWLALPLFAVFYSLLLKLQVYTMAGFVPIMMLALLNRQVTKLALPAWSSRVPLLLVITTSLACMSAFVRAEALGYICQREGHTFAHAREVVRQVKSQLHNPAERVGFMWLARPSFVVFSAPGKGLLSLEPEIFDNQTDPFLDAYETIHRCQVRYVFVPQHGYWVPPPPAPPSLAKGKFAIKQDGWTTKPAMLAGFKVADAVPGYQFALYQRVD